MSSRAKTSAVPPLQLPLQTEPLRERLVRPLFCLCFVAAGCTAANNPGDAAESVLLDSHTKPVFALAFSPDSMLLASGGGCRGRVLQIRCHRFTVTPVNSTCGTSLLRGAPALCRT